VVPDRQLSLAIGEEGQNARLAGKLTGWQIDIRSESEVRAELEPEPQPEPVAAVVEAAPVVEEDAEPSHALIAEVAAESAMADEDEAREQQKEAAYGTSHDHGGPRHNAAPDHGAVGHSARRRWWRRSNRPRLP